MKKALYEIVKTAVATGVYAKCTPAEFTSNVCELYQNLLNVERSDYLVRANIDRAAVHVGEILSVGTKAQAEIPKDKW